MGAELMKLAMHHGGALSGNAYKVLMRMSCTAMDRPKDDKPERRYFAGWEPLALALGWELPAPSSRADTDMRRRKKLQSYVSAAIKELTDAGFVEPFHPGRRAGFGCRQEYRILTGLGPQGAGCESTPGSGVRCTPQNEVQQHPTERADGTPPNGVPRKNKDQTQDLGQERNSSSRVRLALPRERPAR